ncbi:hypothetical protein O181_040895 [Austropuccinia psidii MF-1]|uniref:Uncharacterized protein n=1 Tax=Austropuccinia psidii MF-1 TaxID=1389203 RepID=A0A9Q3DDZ7_9BASI|nr:hypothetical protein [Austropuccinia psidii MF-1]
MSSKLTELTESSPSALPPSVLCGSGVFSQLSSPSMASSGHFDPSPKYDGYKAVEVLDPSCTECLARGKDFFQHYNPHYSKCHYGFIGKRPCRHTRVPTSNVRRYLWSRKDGPFWKEFTVPEEPTPDGTSGYSHCRGMWKGRLMLEGQFQIRRISESPTDPDAEGSDEFDGEEVVVVSHSADHQSSTSSSQPLYNRFQSQGIPSTPKTFQPVLASIPTSIPPASPSPSHARPALNQAVRPSPNQQPRNSPITTSQQLQPMASSSRRRYGLSPLPFPSTQAFQRRDIWPIQITREDPNAASENQEAVARSFGRVYRNSIEVTMYANDRTIPGTASKEMAAKFAWYEDELINDFQRTFDDLGRDN